MKKIIVVIIVLITSSRIIAQTQNDNVINEQLGVLHQKKLEKAADEGNYYLSDDPVAMKLLQVDSMLVENILARYNLRDDQFEIGGVGIPGKKVISFEQGSSEYIRNSFISDYLKDQDGFCRVLFQGRYELYAGVDVIFKPSNYNLLMDVGNRSDTYLKEEIYYLFENNQLVMEASTVKKIAKYLKSKHEELSNYSKQNKLSNQETDVVKILAFFDNT